MIGYNRYILGVYMGSIEAKAANPLQPNEATTAKPVQIEVAAEAGGAAHAEVDGGWSTMFGGVPEEAWSPADRERISRGELPEGSPEHPNI